jgi:multiple antibiotic resistance protein
MKASHVPCVIDDYYMRVIILMDSVIFFLNIFGLDLLSSVFALIYVIDPLVTIPLFITITDKKTKK